VDVPDLAIKAFGVYDWVSISVVVKRLVGVRIPVPLRQSGLRSLGLETGARQPMSQHSSDRPGVTLDDLAQRLSYGLFVRVARSEPVSRAEQICARRDIGAVRCVVAGQVGRHQDLFAGEQVVARGPENLAVLGVVRMHHAPGGLGVEGVTTTGERPV